MTYFHTHKLFIHISKQPLIPYASNFFNNW